MPSTASKVGDPLTARQREIFCWICRFIEDRQHFPTIRQIMLAHGMTSPNGAHYTLRMLARKGVIRWRPRAIDSTSAAWDLAGIRVRLEPDDSPEGQRAARLLSNQPEEP